ncbi:MAG: helix-turn-helix transcriptional regulator [Clostridia bacterium]|nr:helix-turn-helix transcriptional regulator [Clostridia bacterium]
MFVKYFFTNNLSIVANVNVISFSYTELSDAPSLIHSHPHCEIIIPLNSNGYLICGDKQIPITDNHIYIINPAVSHTEINLVDKKGRNAYTLFKYYVVKINEQIYDKDGVLSDCITLSNSELIGELKDTLKKAYKSVTKNQNTLTTLNLSIFYYQFTELLAEKHCNKSSKPLAPMHTDFIKEFDYFVSKNYNIEINIADFAKQHNISHDTFIRKCKEETGYTPSAYILKKRLDISKHLLSTSNFTIYQIAQMCGFISAAYFTMQFKKREKITPSQFRQSL